MMGNQFYPMLELACWLTCAVSSAELGLVEYKENQFLLHQVEWPRPEWGYSDLLEFNGLHFDRLGFKNKPILTASSIA